MKILHVIDVMPEAAGTSSFISAMADEFVDMGHSVAVALNEDKIAGHKRMDPHVRCVSLDDVASDFSDFDVVHIHSLWRGIMHRAALLARQNEIPVIWSPHGTLLPWAFRHKLWKKWPVWKLWQERDLKRAAFVHVTSVQEREWVIRRGIDVQRVVHLPLGVHMPMEVHRHKHNNFVLLFVGRIHPVKGLENLLKAWKRVVDCVAGKKVELRLVGTDNAHYEPVLRLLARQLGIEPFVRFCGPKYGSDLDDEYQGADVLILPSFTENFGAVVIDAMAWGIPVVAAKGTPWKILEEGRCGWWVENAPEILANAIVQSVVIGEAERVAMGARARHLVAKEFSWKLIANKMADVYRTAISIK